jgi:hypothetical protein
MKSFAKLILLLILAIAGAPAALAQLDPQPPLPQGFDLLPAEVAHPRATATMLAEHSFMYYGLDSPRLFDASPNDPWDLRLDVSGGRFTHDNGRGRYATAALGLEHELSEHLSLGIAFPTQYRRLDSLEIYDTGFILALPIHGRRSPDTHFVWQITPHAHLARTFADEAERSGRLHGGGLTGALGYRTSHTSIVLSQQWGRYQGRSMEVAGVHVDTDVVEQILRTGLKVSQRFGDTTIELGVIHTRMRQPAGVRQFTSPVLGVRLTLGESVDARIGYSADIARGFRRHAAHAGLLVQW